MVSKKYIGDYRLEDSLDARGRLRSTAVYIGGDYGFADPAQACQKARLCALWLQLSAWLLFIGALFPKSAASRAMCCVLPLAVCALPLGIGAVAVCRLLAVREPFTRERADKISQRLPIAALLTLIFSGLAVLGFGVLAVWGGDAPGPGDVAFAICAAALAAVSAAALRLARRFKTHRLQ